MIRALLISMDFIKANKSEIFGFLEKNWGIKNAGVREGFYADMVAIFSRTGIISDELVRNVFRFVQETRKTQDTFSPADITDWSFAKKANEQLKR